VVVWEESGRLKNPIGQLETHLLPYKYFNFPTSPTHLMQKIGVPLQSVQ